MPNGNVTWDTPKLVSPFKEVVERNVGYCGACIELGEANSSVCEFSDFQTSL